MDSHCDSAQYTRDLIGSITHWSLADNQWYDFKNPSHPLKIFILLIAIMIKRHLNLKNSAFQKMVKFKKAFLVSRRLELLAWVYKY